MLDARRQRASPSNPNASVKAVALLFAFPFKSSLCL